MQGGGDGDGGHVDVGDCGGVVGGLPDFIEETPGGEREGAGTDEGDFLEFSGGHGGADGGEFEAR